MQKFEIFFSFYSVSYDMGHSTFWYGPYDIDMYHIGFKSDSGSFHFEFKFSKTLFFESEQFNHWTTKGEMDNQWSTSAIVLFYR